MEICEGVEVDEVVGVEVDERGQVERDGGQVEVYDEVGWR